ncbi:MAG TPA: EFR1 family ferrodoxin [Bacteroidales bacterium]|nr:EFR1 family ferrodoxin [Bacteroidales bacterium]
MILYFSGNGNSRWVAEQLAKLTGEKSLDLSVYIRKGISSDEIKIDGDSLGLVFPIHSWYAPKPVVDFVKHLHVPNNVYCYAVSTCGDDAGKGMSRLAKHFRLDAAWTVVMPNTYIPMFNLDSDELAGSKIYKAYNETIPSISKNILLKRKIWQVHEGPFPWLKTYVIQPLFVKFMIRSRNFHIEGHCNHCGKCVQSCPVGNVYLSDAGPVWKDNCIHCMGCIHICPLHIIQYAHSTQKRGRYQLKKYLK